MARAISNKILKHNDWDFHHDAQCLSVKSRVKPRLHEQFLCGNCIWQFLFACVDDRQIFVFKLRQAMLDGQNLGTLETGFYICR